MDKKPYNQVVAESQGWQKAYEDLWDVKEVYKSKLKALSEQFDAVEKELQAILKITGE